MIDLVRRNGPGCHRRYAASNSACRARLLHSRLRTLHLATLLAASAHATALAADPSGLVWDSKVIEIASEPEAKSISAEFTFRYGSGHPVTISGITTSCGCVTTHLAKAAYLPGETGRLNVSTDIAGRIGEFQAALSVNTVEPVRDAVQLTLRVIIRTFVSIEPRAVFWAAGSESGERSVAVTAQKPYLISSVTASSADPRVVARIVTRTPGLAYQVVVDCLQPSVRLTAKITVVVNIQDIGVRTFDFFALVR